jgi:hypothetical protein
VTTVATRREHATPVVGARDAYRGTLQFPYPTVAAVVVPHTSPAIAPVWRSRASSTRFKVRESNGAFAAAVGRGFPHLVRASLAGFYDGRPNTHPA